MLYQVYQLGSEWSSPLDACYLRRRYHPPMFMQPPDLRSYMSLVLVLFVLQVESTKT